MTGLLLLLLEADGDGLLLLRELRLLRQAAEARGEELGLEAVTAASHLLLLAGQRRQCPDLSPARLLLLLLLQQQ